MNGALLSALRAMQSGGTYEGVNRDPALCRFGSNNPAYARVVVGDEPRVFCMRPNEAFGQFAVSFSA